MTGTQRALAATPHARSTALGVVLVLLGAAVAGVLASGSPASSSSASRTQPAASSAAALPISRPSRGNARQGQLGLADGVVPDGTTVFADGIPGVSRLDPALLAALRRAGTDAASDGVDILVTSGWRSRSYQEQLFRQAVAKYGSAQEAAQWVAAPGASAHETGSAVDIGRADAVAWLAEHGAEYGLCRVYGNEPWHYELRPAAATHGCPPLYADPSHDPRLQQ